MGPVRAAYSRQDCFERLRRICSRMAACPDQMEKQYRARILEFGQWLVDAEKCGMPWAVGYLTRLQDLMSHWKFVQDDRAASLEMRRRVFRVALEVSRVCRYTSSQYVRPARRPRARRRVPGLRIRRFA